MCVPNFLTIFKTIKIKIYLQRNEFFLNSSIMVKWSFLLAIVYIYIVLLLSQETLAIRKVDQNKFWRILSNS